VVIVTLRNFVVIRANGKKKANLGDEISGWDIRFPIKFSRIFVFFVVKKAFWTGSI